MDITIPTDRSELNLLQDDEIERLLALELACACLLAHNESLEPVESMPPAAQRAA
jgi:hypothetical protein